MRKRIILVARYYSIEPLGILYLAGVVRDAGWECKIVLIDEFDFDPLFKEVAIFKPDLVGFQIWTGYHTPSFAACDMVRTMGTEVIIGGPHATYFHEECARHADYVIKGGAFGLFQELLTQGLTKGVHFEKSGRTDAFPAPDRAVVYDAYPELGRSPIKSIFASVGCPYFCTYCYAPAFNQMHGGFALTLRPVDDLIEEARDVVVRCPETKLFYFQDDIFGYDTKWLAEFAQKWRQSIGLPFHAQIRLELTQHDKGAQRLDLFQEAGCTGITLAIESGNAFLRDHVMFRHMDDHLILEGCNKIMERGMSLRTEQILAVPFSDTATDLSTLGFNGQINPTMAWTSILAPYQGTDMGTITNKFGFYTGNNDDLAESFFDRSILRHVRGGPRDMERIVSSMGAGPKTRALLKLQASPVGSKNEKGEWVANVTQAGGGKTLGTLHFLSDEENERYCEDTVRLQRLFNWLAKVPAPIVLGQALINVPNQEWGWNRIGEITSRHVEAHIGSPSKDWANKLASEMGQESLPQPIAVNPAYFAYLPEGGRLAQKALDAGVFTKPTNELLDELGTLTRRHLFHYGLYKLDPARKPIAQQ